MIASLKYLPNAPASRPRFSRFSWFVLSTAGAASVSGGCLVYFYGFESTIGRLILSVGLALVVQYLSIIVTRKDIDVIALLGVSVAFFSVPYFNPPPSARAELEVSSVESAATKSTARALARGEPMSAIITFRGGSLEGKRHARRFSTRFAFKIDDHEIDLLKEDACPQIIIEFQNGDPVILPFFNNNVMPAGFNNYFDMRYKVNEEALSYFRERSSFPVRSCDSEEVNRFADARREMSKEKIPPAPSSASAPPVSPGAPSTSVAISGNGPTGASQSPIRAETLVRKNEPKLAVTASNEAAPSSPTALAPPAETDTSDGNPPADNTAVDGIVGYVVFSQLSADTAEAEHTYFVVQENRDARVPSPGQTIVLTNDEAIVRRDFFRWNSAARAHRIGEPAATMKKGDKAIVGGDALIVHDETNHGAYYVVVPISEIVGANIPKDGEPYPPSSLPPQVKGFVYLGYFDAKNPDLADKSFDNFTSPNSIYPSPDDILVAKSDIWLRSGPRHWDQQRHAYVKPPVISPIHKGEYVRVAGDLVLTGRGTSFWAPISSRKVAAPPVAKEHLTFGEKVSRAVTDIFSK